MTHPTNHPLLPDDELPIELREIARLTDRLGSTERASAPTGLDDRVFRSTRALLADSNRPIPFPVQSQADRGMPRRLAAAVLLVGAVGLSVMGWRLVKTPQIATTSAPVDAAALEDELNTFFASAAEASSPASTELASLAKELDAAAGASDPWGAAESGIDELVNEDSL